jgi:hypothetical protein
VTGGWVTQADRVRWQAQAVRELAAVLDAHGDLPPAAWTVGPAGGALSGRISGLPPAASVREAFTAWRQALGMGEAAETPSGNGMAVYLRARTWRNGVLVTVTATAPGRECEDR